LTLYELILISFGLSMDCFAVSLTFGCSGKLKWKNILSIAFLFGAFQGLMPLLGWFMGQSIRYLIEPVDHWIAFAILAVIGLKMIWQSFLAEDEKKSLDIANPVVVLSLAFATSIDALVTGVGFGFIKVNIAEAVVMISLITFVVSVTGAKLGEQTKFIPARWAEFTGGLVLLSIGLKVLLEHLHIL